MFYQDSVYVSPNLNVLRVKRKIEGRQENKPD